MIKVKAFGILAALAALPVFAEPSAGQGTGEGNGTTTAEYGLRYSTLARAGTLAVRPTSEATGLSFTLGAETFDKAIALGTEWRPIVFVPSAVTVTEIAVAIPGTEAPASLTVTPKDGEPVTFTPTKDAESVTLTDTDGSTAAATLRTYENTDGVTLAPGQACGFVFDDTEVGTAPRNFYTFNGAPHLRIEGSATITRHVLNISDGETHSFTALAGLDEDKDQADQVFVVEFSGAGGTLEMDGALQNAPLVIGSSVSSTKAAVSFDSAFTVPLSLRDGEGDAGGVSLTFGEGEAFNPSALLLACNAILKSPLTLPTDAWLATHAVPIPAGRTFRIELEEKVEDFDALPNLSFAAANSVLELALAGNPQPPYKYVSLMATQSGTLVFDQDVTLSSYLTLGGEGLETTLILRAGHTYEFPGSRNGGSGIVTQGDGVTLIQEGGTLTLGAASTGAAPFTLGEVSVEYRKPGIAWSRLTECFASPDGGQYDLTINTTAQAGVGGRFYVDTARSADGVWYVEGAFIAGEDYAGEALRVDMTVPGAEAPALSVALPEFDTLPHISSADGAVTLSAAALRIAGQDMFVVDEAEYIALVLRDGTVQVIEERAAGVDRTLYALGSMAGETGTYVLSFAPELENVRSVIVNDIEYMVK